MILYLAVLASLLGLTWIIYIYCTVPVSDFERLWPNEWHVTLSNPHVSKFAAMEAEEAGINAKPSIFDPALLRQALSAIPHHPHTPTVHTAAPPMSSTTLTRRSLLRDSASGCTDAVAEGTRVLGTSIPRLCPADQVL